MEKKSNLGKGNIGTNKKEYDTKIHLREIAKMQKKLYNIEEPEFDTWADVQRRELVEYGYLNDMEIMRNTKSFKANLIWAI